MTESGKRKLRAELDRIRKTQRKLSTPKVAFCIVSWLFAAAVGAVFVATSRSPAGVATGVLLAVTGGAAIVTMLLQRWVDQRLSIVLEVLLTDIEDDT